MRNTCVGAVLRFRDAFSCARSRGVHSVSKVCAQVNHITGFFSTRLFSIGNNTYEFSSPGRSDVNEVGVFWDFENCPVPIGVDPFVVKPNIELALRKSGFQGPVFVNGYGNIQLMSRGHVLEALSETGIDIHHVPSGGKNSSDRALLVDVLLWANKRLPPAHVFLISGDSDFSILLHKLRMLNYSVLLAIPNRGVSSALTSAADKMWFWQDIVRGEALVGKTLLHGLAGSPGKDCSSDASIKDKDALLPENTLDLSEGNGGDLEILNDTCPPSNTMKSLLVPPIALDRIFDIIRAKPGITLGDLSKELRDVNIQVSEYKSFCAFMLSTQGIEVWRVNTSSWKDRYRFYLPGIDINRGTDEKKYLIQQKERVPTERQEMGKDKIIKLENSNSFKQGNIPEQLPVGQHWETAHPVSHTTVKKADESESMNAEKKRCWRARFLSMLTKPIFMKSR